MAAHLFPVVCILNYRLGLVKPNLLCPLHRLTIIPHKKGKQGQLRTSKESKNKKQGILLQDVCAQAMQQPARAREDKKGKQMYLV